MLAKLTNVGVVMVCNFVSLVLEVNQELLQARHWQLHRTTLGLMLREACDMMFGLQDN